MGLLYLYVSVSPALTIRTGVVSTQCVYVFPVYQNNLLSDSVLSVARTELKKKNQISTALGCAILSIPGQSIWDLWWTLMTLG